MKQLEILRLAGLVFTAVKFSFVIAQWIFEKDGDKILRRNLDTIWDELNRLTFRQVAMRLLVRIVEKMRALLQAPRNPRGKLFLAFFILNIVAYVIAQSLFCALENECGRTLGHDEVLSEYGAGRLTHFITHNFIYPLQVHDLMTELRDELGCGGVCDGGVGRQEAQQAAGEAGAATGGQANGEHSGRVWRLG